MKDALTVLLERRSIRRYKPEQISDRELEQIINAGLYAPSAMNRQPVKIIALQNKEDIAYLSKLNDTFHANKNGDPFFAAPTVLIVLAEADNKNGIRDGSLVMGNLMNAACALGIGSCWINRAEEVFDSEEGKALLEKWGVEGNYKGVGNCILGYPDETPRVHTIKENRVVYIR